MMALRAAAKKASATAVRSLFNSAAPAGPHTPKPKSMMPPEVYPLVGIMVVGASWMLYMSQYSAQSPDVAWLMARRANGGNLEDSDFEHKLAEDHFKHRSAPRAFITDVVGTYTERSNPAAFPHDRFKDPKLVEKH